MCEYGLNINFLILGVKLAVVVLVFIRGLPDCDREINDIVVQLHLTHGVIAFETYRVAAVEHAFHGKATDDAEVERLVVFGLRPAEVKPIGRSKPTRDSNVVLCF